MIATSHYERKIHELLLQDPFRLQALNTIAQLNLPQCFIAAGFVRNLVWDHLHSKTTPTPLNDIDVIYFDASEQQKDKYQEYETKLHSIAPKYNWQVRNQAFMHTRNGDKPYNSTLDAIGYWPEKETALAVRKINQNQFECISAFGFESLFAMQVTHNPRRKLEVFNLRVHSKDWLATWPNLTIVS
ncbi:nucleotidyltransferase family protein [Vibrio sp. HN007]|uniref:nucleotidyltransferase family protein n=1 Tax=Vibrio iocasae TaxID=3098914 RepID=UPI0035D51639